MAQGGSLCEISVKVIWQWESSMSPHRPFPYRSTPRLAVAYLDNSQKPHKIVAKCNFAQLAIDKHTENLICFYRFIG